MSTLHLQHSYYTCWSRDLVNWIRYLLHGKQMRKTVLLIWYYLETLSRLQLKNIWEWGQWFDGFIKVWNRVENNYWLLRKLCGGLAAVTRGIATLDSKWLLLRRVETVEKSYITNWLCQARCMPNSGMKYVKVVAFPVCLIHINVSRYDTWMKKFSQHSGYRRALFLMSPFALFYCSKLFPLSKMGNEAFVSIWRGLLFPLP